MPLANTAGLLQQIQQQRRDRAAQRRGQSLQAALGIGGLGLSALSEGGQFFNALEDRKLATERLSADKGIAASNLQFERDKLNLGLGDKAAQRRHETEQARLDRESQEDLTREQFQNILDAIMARGLETRRTSQQEFTQDKILTGLRTQLAIVETRLARAVDGTDEKLRLDRMRLDLLRRAEEREDELLGPTKERLEAETGQTKALTKKIEGETEQAKQPKRTKEQEQLRDLEVGKLIEQARTAGLLDPLTLEGIMAGDFPDSLPPDAQEANQTMDLLLRVLGEKEALRIRSKTGGELADIVIAARDYAATPEEYQAFLNTLTSRGVFGPRSLQDPSVGLMGQIGRLRKGKDVISNLILQRAAQAGRGEIGTGELIPSDEALREELRDFLGVAAPIEPEHLMGLLDPFRPSRRPKIRDVDEMGPLLQSIPGLDEIFQSQLGPFDRRSTAIKMLKTLESLR